MVFQEAEKGIEYCSVSVWSFRIYFFVCRSFSSDAHQHCLQHCRIIRQQCCVDFGLRRLAHGGVAFTPESPAGRRPVRPRSRRLPITRCGRNAGAMPTLVPHSNGNLSVSSSASTMVEPLEKVASFFCFFYWLLRHRLIRHPSKVVTGRNLVGYRIVDTFLNASLLDFRTAA